MEELEQEGYGFLKTDHEEQNENTKGLFLEFETGVFRNQTKRANKQVDEDAGYAQYHGTDEDESSSQEKPREEKRQSLRMPISLWIKKMKMVRVSIMRAHDVSCGHPLAF